MMTTACLISIGNELLIGQTIDTNSVWLSKELISLGIYLRTKIVVGDSQEDIYKAIDFAKNNANIIFMTGGLGPTSDDITKEVVANYMGDTQFVTDQDSVKRIIDFFKHKNRQVLDVHINQANLPQGARPIPNMVGTAPGMWFDKEQHQFIVLPGVPIEMKSMVKRTVLPILAQSQTSAILHKTIVLYGKGESDVALMLKEFESKLPQGISLAYLPNQSLLRLRLTSLHNKSDNELRKREINKLHEELASILKDNILAKQDDSLQDILGKKLSLKGKTIATAESCTGGFVGHLITSVSGSSAYYKGGMVAYDNTIKQHHLNVSEDILKQYGAVSEEVVSEMAKNTLESFSVDYAVALSGIMELPAEQNISTKKCMVWIGLASKYSQHTQLIYLRHDRVQNIKDAANAALAGIIKFID